MALLAVASHHRMEKADEIIDVPEEDRVTNTDPGLNAHTATDTVTQTQYELSQFTKAPSPGQHYTILIK